MFDICTIDMDYTGCFTYSILEFWKTVRVKWNRSCASSWFSQISFTELQYLRQFVKYSEKTENCEFFFILSQLYSSIATESGMAGFQYILFKIR